MGGILCGNATSLRKEDHRKALSMPRVLLIEDEVLFRRILTMNLVHRGYTVIEADSVATAREALQVFEFQFDLILLDINLPDQTGWDVLRYLEAACSAEQQRGNVLPHLPVIILTAVRPTSRRLVEFHPKAVLVKPFPIEVLLRLTERVIAPFRSKRADDAARFQQFPENGATPLLQSISQRGEEELEECGM